MRALIQRVSRAEVRVEGRPAGVIGRGLVVLLGVTHADGAPAADWLARKVAGLRLFSDATGGMNLGLAEVGGGVLVVPQFTLYGDARRGRRPEFVAAARPEHAEPLFERFCDTLAAVGCPVARGVFRAAMELELVNDGPVTLMVESPAEPAPAPEAPA